MAITDEHFRGDYGFQNPAILSLGGAFRLGGCRRKLGHAQRQCIQYCLTDPFPTAATMAVAANGPTRGIVCSHLQLSPVSAIEPISRSPPPTQSSSTRHCCTTPLISRNIRGD